MRIFFIHWNEDELKEKLTPLKKAGYKIEYHFAAGVAAKITTESLGALIICLDRLPSHGTAYAEWMWSTKKRQQIPIVFCGGVPEKIKAVQLKFPDAIYCSNEALLSVLNTLT